ncbi:MAG: MarR family transcriptional regulator, partial [Christiangramia sp.]
SRILKTMEEKGLIIRKKNPNDGRSVLIYLTEFGKEMRDYSKRVVLRFDEAVKENVSDKDLKTFINVANTILELISEKKIYTEEIKIR